MATVYKAEVVSHWINYPKEDLEKLLQEVIDKINKETKNEIKITIEERL
jgi:hypothetical protein